MRFAHAWPPTVSHPRAGSTISYSKGGRPQPPKRKRLTLCRIRRRAGVSQASSIFRAEGSNFYAIAIAIAIATHDSVSALFLGRPSVSGDSSRLRGNDGFQPLPATVGEVPKT